MRLFKNTKDDILEYLINSKNGVHTDAIAAYLSIDSFTVATYLEEMAEMGHIEILEAASKGYFMRSYSVRQIYPKGYHFAKYKTYKQESIKKWWREAPKNYWVIGTLFGLITTNTALVTKLISKEDTVNTQKGQIIQPVVRQDTTLQQ